MKRNTFKILLYSTLITGMLLSACQGKGGQKNDNADKASSQALPRDIANVVDEDLLRETSFSGNTQKVKELLSKNVNLNAVDQDGRSALMYAAFNGHTEIVKALLEKGASVNAADYTGRTALIFASSGSYPETVKLLLEHKADPNIVDNVEKFTALMFAAAEGHVEIVRILLENKADPGLKDKDDDTAETFARQNGHTAVADLLKSYRP